MRVLLVDDDRLVRVTLAAGLRNLAIAVTEAEDGLEALRLWSPGAFEVVLSDIDMPGLDGLELAHRIREQDSSSNLPSCRLIALTGSATNSTLGRQLMSRFDQILTKPVDIDQVRTALIA